MKAIASPWATIVNAAPCATVIPSSSTSRESGHSPASGCSLTLAACGTYNRQQRNPLLRLFPAKLPKASGVTFTKLSLRDHREKSRRHLRQHRLRSEEHTSELQSLRHLVCRL